MGKKAFLLELAKQLWIVPLQDLLEKKVESRHAVLNGSGCQLLVPQQVKLKLANLFDAD